MLRSLVGSEMCIRDRMNIDRYPLSLPDGEGKLAIDYVDSEATGDYKELLTPSYKFNFMHLELKLLQANFHEIILERVGALVEKYNLILPIISVIIEDISKHKEIYFNVPGMCGGFTYWLEFDETKTEIVALWSRSSSKLIGNSEQVHKCTAQGWTLMKGQE